LEAVSLNFTTRRAVNRR